MTLTIDTQRVYKGNQRLVAADANETDGFASAVNEALQLICSTEVGDSLLRAIEGAGQAVLIVKAEKKGGGKSQDNACVQSSHTELAYNAACYQEVLNHIKLHEKIQELISRKTITEEHPAARKYRKFHGEGSSYWGNFEQYPHPVPLAHKKTGDRVHLYDYNLKNKIEELYLTTDEQKQAVTPAITLVNYHQNGLVAYHIMGYLTPGSGTGAWVVWDPLLKNVGTDLSPQKQADWMVRPPWIGLAHELIHGWRLATGRCVFRPGEWTEEYYEEAMTVGLPPYDQCRFTENRFRQLKGLALRTFYGETTRNQSARAASKHGTAESRIKALNQS
jgi:hypothetical protein